VNKVLDFSTLLLVAVCVRSIIFGASIGDACMIAAISALHGYKLYLDSIKQQPLNDIVLKELSDMKSTINALKLAKGIGR
jgi:hypothetical protein